MESGKEVSVILGELEMLAKVIQTSFGLPNS